MSRPILKLPNKPAVSRADGELDSWRKPIRQGVFGMKRSVVRRDERVMDSAPRLERRPAASNNGQGHADAGRSSAPGVTPNTVGEAKRPPVNADFPPRDDAIDQPTIAAKWTTASPTARPRSSPRKETDRIPAGRPVVPQPSSDERVGQPTRGLARRIVERTGPLAAQVKRAVQPSAIAKPMATVTGPLPDAVVPAPVAGSVPARGPARELPRLARLVCELAGCSRREADEWLQNGWVRVDGAVVDRLGARVSPKARIEIAAAVQRPRAAAVTIIYYQAAPVGQGAELPAISPLEVGKRWADDAPGGQPSAARLPASRLHNLPPVGRLAADECGMQVFSEQGGVARRLSDARIEHEFHVRIAGTPSAEGLERLRYGQRIAGIKLKRAQVSLSSDGLLRFVLRDHRPGQIAERCRQVGLQVLAIKRVRIGSVSLGRLPAGQWRFLRPDERF